MKTNPSAKRILMYGDSIVYGKVPREEKRFSIQDTFPGVIQDTLGDDYEILAEGLRGRMLAGDNPLRPERNGLTQFGPIFGSHLPLDLVVILLGTNDCNNPSVKSESEYKDSLNEYCKKVSEWCTSFCMPLPKLLLIAPPPMLTEGILQDPTMTALFGEQAQEKSLKIAEIYRAFCAENSINYFDAQTVCSVAANEGVHLDIENNTVLGQALAVKIKEILHS